MKWNKHILDAETWSIVFEIEKSIPDEIKQDAKLYNQVMNHTIRKAVKIRMGKLRPICEKYRKIEKVVRTAISTGKTTDGILIKEYSMKRVYTKRQLENIKVKRWTPIGWVCPHCLNMITDKEAIEEQKNNEKVMKDTFDRLITQVLQVARSKSGAMEVKEEVIKE